LGAGRGYAVAFAAVAAATLLMFAFYSVVGIERGRMPFVFYFGAVMSSARFGGRGPGLLSVILSTLAADFFFLRLFSFRLIVLQSVVFVLVALMIVVLTEKSRRAEATAREAGESLATTLRSIGDAVIATDAGGRVTYLNPVAERMTGWKAMEARGRPLAEVFHIVNEETRAEVESPVDKALRGGLVVGLANHTLLISKDGAETPIDDSGAPIKDESGAIIGAVLVFHDITERRRAEEAQRENEERYRALADAMPQIIWTARADGYFDYYNKRWFDYTGMTLEQTRGWGWQPVLHPDDV
jgi:PAS domain S-box-containing protein